MAGTRAPQPRRWPGLPHWEWILPTALLLGYLAFPLLAHPRATVYGEAGDNYATLGAIAALAGLQPGVPAPRGFDLQPLVDLPAAALARLVGPIPAYNLVLLAGFAVAAGLGYLAARRLQVCPSAGAVGGLLFGFSPYHLAHAREHLDQSQVGLAALVLWACLGLIALPSWRRALVLVLCAMLAVLSNWYLLVVLLPLVGMTLLQTLVSGPASGRRVVGGIVAIGVVIGWVGYRGIGADGRQRLGQAIDPVASGDVERYSARLGDYLRPAADHPLLGAWSGARFEAHRHGSSPVEQTLYLGFAALGAAAIGGRRLWLAGGAARRQGLVLVLTAGVALWLSLAPGWGGSALVVRWFPWIRATARFGCIVQLVVAMLAAVGLSRVSGRTRLGLLLVMGLEYLPRHHAHPVEPVELLAQFDRPGVFLADLPVEPTRYLRHFRRPQAAVAVSRSRLLELGVVAPDPTAAALLAAAGATHVVFHGERPPPWPVGLTEVARFRGAWVARIEVEPPAVAVHLRGGFEAPEPTGRWLGATPGQIWLAVRSDLDRVDGELCLRAASLELPRTLQLGADGAIQIEIAPTTACLALTVETPGRHLRIAAEPGAVRADAVLGNGDPRELAVWFSRCAFEVRREWQGSRGLAFDDGFEPVEPDGRRWFTASARLGLVGGPGRLAFEANAHRVPRVLSVHCEDRELLSAPVPADGWGSYQVEVPQGCPVVLLAADGALPESGETADGAGRSLSVGLRRVRWGHPTPL